MNNSPTKMIRQVLALGLVGVAALAGRAAETRAGAPAVQAVAATDAHWTGGLWRQKLEVVATGVLPRLLAGFQSGATPHLRNFRLAAGLEQGGWTGAFSSDGELCAWLEAAAGLYAANKDPALDRSMDELIEVLAKAQQPDGYLATAVQVGTGTAEPDCGSGAAGAFREARRFVAPRFAELDNLGRLFSAAAAHHAATGKTNLLDVATKAADLVCAELARPATILPRLARVPAIVGGAMDLFRLTGDRRYLEMARTFVDRRGVTGKADPGALQHAYTADFTDEKSSAAGTDQFQERTPVREEREAVGNTLSAHQLYAGAAAVCAATDDRRLGLALEKIWENAAWKKMTVTGATGTLVVGVSSGGYKSWGDKVAQAYGAEYELPNAGGFYGTCGNVGFAFWNWRMFERTGEARYLDTLERVAHNAALAGMSLDGSAFATSNPLRRDAASIGEEPQVGPRPASPAASCCAVSVARLISKMATWAYGVSTDGLWVNLYGASTLATHLADGAPVNLTQRTDYPWNGNVTLSLDVPQPAAFALRLRVPGWCRSADARVWVNHRPVPVTAKAGWFTLDRKWVPGDVVRLDLPMPVELLAGHPQAEELRGRVAVQRGPLVYCLEGGDLAAGTRVEQVRLARDTEFTSSFATGLLGGVQVLDARVRIEHARDWNGELYRQREPPQWREAMVRFVPYFTWNNRGVTDMAVWFPLRD